MNICIKHPKKTITGFMSFPDMNQVQVYLQEHGLNLCSGVEVYLENTPYSYIREGNHWREVVTVTNNTSNPPNNPPSNPSSNKPMIKSNDYKRNKRRGVSQRVAEYSYEIGNSELPATPRPLHEGTQQPEQQPEQQSEQQSEQQFEQQPNTPPVVEKTDELDSSNVGTNSEVVRSTPITNTTISPYKELPPSFIANAWASLM